MTDYLTLVIDDRIIEFFVYFFIAMGIFSVIRLFIWIIVDSIKTTKIDKRRVICKPYRDRYEKFIKNEEYRKALDYGHKYGEYVFDESVKGYFD